MWATGIFLNCNVYWNCPTGCRYCYVRLNRQSNRYTGSAHSPTEGLHKFSLLVNKVFGSRYNPQNALEFAFHERLPMMLSNNSDPLCSLEAEHGYARQYLQVLADLEYPVQILTKAAGWNQLDQDAYIDLFKRFPKLWVSVTITAETPEVSRRWEPGAPTPEQRLTFCRQLTEAGIPVEVHCTPWIPDESFQGAWDDAGSYRPFLQAVKAAGCFGVTIAPLCYDHSDAAAVTQADREYVKAHEWCNSAPDRPWRYFLPDVSIMAEVNRLFYAEAKALNLECGLHPAFVSSVGDGAELQSSCCSPQWVDKRLSWIRAANRLR